MERDEENDFSQIKAVTPTARLARVRSKGPRITGESLVCQASNLCFLTKINIRIFVKKTLDILQESFILYMLGGEVVRKM